METHPTHSDKVIHLLLPPSNGLSSKTFESTPKRKAQSKICSDCFNDLIDGIKNRLLIKCNHGGTRQILDPFIKEKTTFIGI